MGFTSTLTNCTIDRNVVNIPLFVLLFVFFLVFFVVYVALCLLIINE